MKPFTFAFAIMACTGIAMAQTPATTNGGAQRGVPVRKPQPAQKPAKKPVKTAPIVNDFGSLHNTGGTIASGVNGSDDCAAAPAISGAGVHNFDSTAATTGAEGQHNGRQNNDIWYEWTASGDGLASFSTCNDSAGQQNTEYTSDYRYGSNYTNILNFPSTYIYAGDYVVDEPPIADQLNGSISLDRRTSSLMWVSTRAQPEIAGASSGWRVQPATTPRRCLPSFNALLTAAVSRTGRPLTSGSSPRMPDVCWS